MKRYQIRRASSASLDWSAAELLNDFSLVWETSAAPFTEFRALWDDERLHFRFDCVDDDLVLPEAETSKERALGSDRVEIFFAPDLDLKPYYCIEMSPRGDVLAYKAAFYRQMDWEWQCDGLEVSAQIEDNRYSLIGSLPLATLRALNVLKPESHEMLAGLYRAEFSRQEDGNIHSGWMPWVHPQTEKPDFHVPASFGTLELLH